MIDRKEHAIQAKLARDNGVIIMFSNDLDEQGHYAVVPNVDPCFNAYYWLNSFRRRETAVRWAKKRGFKIYE